MARVKKAHPFQAFCIEVEERSGVYQPITMQESTPCQPRLTVMQHPEEATEYFTLTKTPDSIALRSRGR